MGARHHLIRIAVFYGKNYRRYWKYLKPGWGVYCFLHDHCQLSEKEAMDAESWSNHAKVGKIYDLGYKDMFLEVIAIKAASEEQTLPLS